MAISFLAERIGEVDHSKEKFEESIYLLDSDYRVIGMRRATNASGPEPKCGDYFFTHYPIDPSEQGALESAHSLLKLCPLLFRAGKRPMLACFEFLPHTGLILLAVPERKLRKYFDRPATHAAPSEWLNAYDILISPALFSRHQPITTESYSAMHAWLINFYNTLNYGIDEREFDYLVASIAVRLSMLARLCGLRMSLDLTALSYDLRDIHEFSLILPHTLASMLAAKRLSASGAIRLQAVDVIGVGPTVMADFYTATPPARIPELEPLRALAMARGDIFEYMTPPEDPCHVAIQYTLRPARISAQGLKADPPFERGNDGSIWPPHYLGQAAEKRKRGRIDSISDF